MLSQIALGDFHPALMHLPITLVIAGFAMDVCACISKRSSFLTAGHWFFIFAALFLIPTALTGWFAKGLYAPADPDVLNHQTLAIATALFVLSYAFLRTYCFSMGHSFSMYLYLILSLLAVSLIGSTAELGGIVVRGKGILYKSSRTPGYPLPYDYVK